MSMQALFGGENPETITQRLLEELTKLGAVRMEARYSGGNDEGGVDDIHLFGPEDQTVETPSSWSLRKPEPGEDVPWYRNKDGMVSEPHPLWVAADDLLSTEFGTWAGDFSAYGTLHANVQERCAWTDGSYEVPVETSGTEISVQL